ncbi:MAG: hypothetical protein ABW003_07035 [Microvirga sp.]
MTPITSQGEEFGQLAGEAIEAIIRKANTQLELMRLMAAFQIFMDATVALKSQEEGKEAASAFDKDARAALGRRCALFIH